MTSPPQLIWDLEMVVAAAAVVTFVSNAQRGDTEEIEFQDWEKLADQG
jgi:hypothetical protein